MANQKDLICIYNSIKVDIVVNKNNKANIKN